MEHSSHSGTVPVQSRSERFRSYDVADFPEVTGREPEWKHTPVSVISDLLGGTLNGGQYPLSTTLAPGITVDWASRDDSVRNPVSIPEDRASANAWTHCEQALVVRVTGDDIKEATVARTALGDEARAAHTVIIAEPQSCGTIILRNQGSARLSENVEIIVGDSANLTVVSVQEWASDAHHLASHYATVGRGASLKHIVITLSGAVVRVNPSLALVEEGANGEGWGLYFSGAHQHCEQQVFVHHVGPRTRSRVNYKGALFGEGARGVWIGDVLIGRDAAGTDSYEQNRNLILGEGPRADSIPNLEIETGDIEGAGHASATGRFDDEQLFYLQARGITPEEARRLVVVGFLAEIVQQIGSPALEEHLHKVLEAKLETAAREGVR